MKNITFTGLDMNVKKENIIHLKKALNKLKIKQNQIELGILYSENPKHRNRYPKLKEIKEILKFRNILDINFSLHVCGTGAINQLLNPYSQQFLDIIYYFDRIQINGIQLVNNIENVCNTYKNKYNEIQFISQYDKEKINNIHMEINYNPLTVKSSNHSILLDSSGGEGKKTLIHEIPITFKSIGIAGGINPENVESIIENNFHLRRFDSWIDMESGIRTDDWFDMDKVIDIIQKVHNMEILN